MEGGSRLGAREQSGPDGADPDPEGYPGGQTDGSTTPTAQVLALGQPVPLAWTWAPQRLLLGMLWVGVSSHLVHAFCRPHNDSHGTPENILKFSGYFNVHLKMYH